MTRWAVIIIVHKQQLLYTHTTLITRPSKRVWCNARHWWRERAEVSYGNNSVANHNQVQQDLGGEERATCVLPREKPYHETVPESAKIGSGFRQPENNNPPYLTANNSHIKQICANLWFIFMPTIVFGRFLLLLLLVGPCEKTYGDGALNTSISEMNCAWVWMEEVNNKKITMLG